MTDMTARKAKPIHLLNDDKEFLFLPRQENSDFTIVCSDDRWGDDDIGNAGGALSAFAVTKSSLVKDSAFFADLFELSGKTEESGSDGDRIYVDERAHVVANLLSAVIEPSGQFLSGLSDWQTLNEVLILSIKWKMNNARNVVFLAMLSFVLNVDTFQAKFMGLDVVNFFVEAVRLGTSALTSAAGAFRVRAQAATPVVFRMLRLKFSELHFLEVGAAGCSDVAHEIMNLQAEDALKCIF